MKRALLYVAAICVLAAPSLTYADTAKMDLWLQQMASAPVAKGLMLGKAVQVSGDAALVSCFVKTTDIVATEAAIIDAGGIVNTVLDTILTAAIPAEMLTAISDREEVVALESSQLLTSKMNFARGPTRVDDVQAGVGVDVAYDGSGVMVGVVDDSLDWEHADFGGTSNTRIRYLRQGTGTSAVTCDRNEILDDTCNITSFSGFFHGSHVTGIAAGGDSTYTGVATGAWIGFAFNVATDADSGGSFATVVLDGVSALFAEADTAELPAVVNLSLGTSIGAHDGTSLLEQGLDQSVSGEQGRIIVNAAGNEDADLTGFPAAKQPYVGGIHADINVPAGTAHASRFVVWRASSAGAIARYLMGFTGALVADVWLAQGNNANCSIDVKAYSYDPAAGTGTGFVPAPGDDTDNADVVLTGAPDGIAVAAGGTASGDDGIIGVSVVTDGSDPNNSKPRAIVGIGMAGGGTCSSNAGCARFEEYYYDVIIRETSGTGTCTGDMWLYPDQPSLFDFIGGTTGIAGDVIAAGVVPAKGTLPYTMDDGDSFKTTTIPGTAIDVVTAGAYLARADYTDIDGATQSGGSGTAGQTTLFSSLGPTADGRTKPEVIAPGQPIISTLDSTYVASTAEKGDDTHFVLSGTSMASPHVTGIIALMLEKNNCLTTAQVKAAIAAQSNATGLTSYTAVTGAANTYGAGLIDAVALIKAITPDTSCYGGSGPSNGGGGSGCGTIVPVTSSGAALPALAFLFGPAVIVWLKRRRKKF